MGDVTRSRRWELDDEEEWTVRRVVVGTQWEERGATEGCDPVT